MSRRASYREGLSFGALSFLFVGAFGVLSGIIIAQVYGVRVIGEFALVTAPVHAVWFLSTVRERPALIRELTRLELQAPRITALFFAVFSFSFVLTAVVAPLGLLVTYFVFRGPIGQPELFVPAAVNMAGYLVLTNTSFNLDTIFAAFRDGRALFFLRAHEQVAFTVFAVALGLESATVWGPVLATVGAAFTALVHRMVSVRRVMRLRVTLGELRRAFDTLPEILRFGLKSAPGGIADGVSNECGIWILGVAGTVSAVGAYSRAQSLAGRFVTASFRVNEMLFPTLIERRATGDDAGFARALVDSVRYAVVMMLLPAAAAGGAATAVMELFGTGFSQAAPALVVVLLAPAFATASNFLRHMLYALNQPARSSVSGGIRMGVTLATTIPLTIGLGAIGTAIGIVLGYVADLTFMLFTTRPSFAHSPWLLWPLRERVAVVAAYGVGFATAHGVNAVIAGPLGLAPALLAGTAGYLLVFYLIGGVNDRDRARLADGRERLRSRRLGEAVAAS